MSNGLIIRRTRKANNSMIPGYDYPSENPNFDNSHQLFATPKNEAHRGFRIQRNQKGGNSEHPRQARRKLKSMKDQIKPYNFMSVDNFKVPSSNNRTILGKKSNKEAKKHKQQNLKVSYLDLRCICN